MAASPNLTVVWVAILAAVPILAATTFFVPRSPADPPWLPLVVLGAGLGPALASLMVGSAIRVANPASAALVKLALAESVAVLGLVFYAIGGPHVVAMGMMAVSLSLIILHRPAAAPATGG